MKLFEVFFFTYQVIFVNVWDSVLYESQSRKFEDSELLFGSFFADLEKAHFGFVELVIDF
jgi:hypothetical protein